METTACEAEFRSDLSDKNVAELETLYGVLESNDQQQQGVCAAIS